MSAKAILNTIPTMQSIGLASGAYRMTKPKNHKKGLKRIVGGTTKILVGIPLTQATANQVAGFP